MSIKLWIAAAAAIAIAVAGPVLAKSRHHSHVLRFTGPIPYAQLAAVDALMAKEYAEIDREMSYSQRRYAALDSEMRDSRVTRRYTVIGHERMSYSRVTAHHHHHRHHRHHDHYAQR
jgi:hypothetical protein